MNISTQTSADLKSICVPQPKYFSLWFNIIPAIEILINIIVIVAAFQSRKRLRHNYVYAYVINALCANTLFGVAFVYETTNRVLSLERFWFSEWPFWLGNQSGNVILRTWWAFRSSFMVSLFLVMSGSISALIYGIRKSSYFVGRKFNHRTKGNDVRLGQSTRRRTETIVIIALNWILPLFLNIASAAGWNCVEYCFCVAGQYNPQLYYCQTDVQRQCSRFLQPQTNSFLLFCLGIWSLEGIFIIYMLITTINRFLKVTKTNTISQVNVKALKTIAVLSLPTNSNKDDESKEQTKHLRMEHISETSNEDFEKSWCSFPSFSYTLKLLIVISIMFLLFTLPIMSVILIDKCATNYILGFVGVFFPLIACLLYGLFAPLVLVYYMSGLRVALRQMIFACKCCTKVTVSATKTSSSTFE